MHFDFANALCRFRRQLHLIIDYIQGKLLHWGALEFTSASVDTSSLVLHLVLLRVKFCVTRERFVRTLNVLNLSSPPNSFSQVRKSQAELVSNKQPKIDGRSTDNNQREEETRSESYESGIILWNCFGWVFMFCVCRSLTDCKPDCKPPLSSSPVSIFDDVTCKRLGPSSDWASFFSVICVDSIIKLFESKSYASRFRVPKLSSIRLSASVKKHVAWQIQIQETAGDFFLQSPFGILSPNNLVSSIPAFPDPFILPLPESTRTPTKKRKLYDDHVHQASSIQIPTSPQNLLRPPLKKTCEKKPRRVEAHGKTIANEDSTKPRAVLKGSGFFVFQSVSSVGAFFSLAFCAFG